ncbi:MAG: endopeptidase La [bacterium]|nr:endopeptidase La [bacterium]MDW8087154.1 endopeptidase La [Candidatus Calescibacterium sp.]
MKEKRITIPLIPLRDLVAFPHIVMPLIVGRPKSLKSLEEALLSDEKLIFLPTQKNSKVNDPKEQDIYAIGTICKIKGHQKMPNDNSKIVVEGLKRGKLISFIDKGEMYLGEIEVLEDTNADLPENKNLVKDVIDVFKSLSKHLNISPEYTDVLYSIKDPGEVTDVIAAQLSIPVEKKQSILEETDVNKRLKQIKTILETELENITSERKSRSKGRIRTESSGIFGQGSFEQDEWREEIEALERKAEEKDLPEKVKEVVLKEVRKLKLMTPLAAEATVVRNYVDWLLSLPWTERSEEKLDLKEAKKVLDEDHWGLEKVKERIIEFLAVRKLAGPSKAPILCLVGPPGVGKTSLGRSIAKSTNRKFVRLSLGGVRDEAEIRGHRRTYIGALPGRIIQMMKKAGTKNPVFLLDEIDKLCADFRGDPAAALLEVLDPEQNHSFLDHYIDIEYDLSEVFFICTANTTYTIPPALLDRMEVIRIPGYTEQEKYEIAKRFIIPKQEKNSGLKEGTCDFSKDATMKIIREYTREAGVRNLEREIGNVIRKIAKKIVEEGIDLESNPKFKVTPKDILKFLGPPKFKPSDVDTKALVGIARGLAWTEFGGDVLMIEVSIIPGSGRLTITGKLGDVMQESVKAAITYVRSRSKELGIDPEFYSKTDIHVHVPEGAVPKDGPSAGITIATAIVSALTKIPVRPDVSMTGEITLRGRILPIGGVKEKLLAAHRYNIKTVLVPKENEKDLEDVPKEVLKTLNIKMVEHMDEVIELALEAPAEKIWKGKGVSIEEGRSPH